METGERCYGYLICSHKCRSRLHLRLLAGSRKSLVVPVSPTSLPVIEPGGRVGCRYALSEQLFIAVPCPSCVLGESEGTLGCANWGASSLEFLLSTILMYTECPNRRIRFSPHSWHACPAKNDTFGGGPNDTLPTHVYQRSALGTA